MNDDQKHNELVKIVATSVAGLLPQFAPRGLTCEMHVEGAVKGAVIGMMTDRGMSLSECADVLEEIVDSMRADAPSDNDNAPAWPPRAN